ncbi:MAG: glycosyltransferase family 4 protein [Asgard group archaeon]|nr:glycosyltransferase family 4 protein [Asgard group archaeon]
MSKALDDRAIDNVILTQKTLLDDKDEEIIEGIKVIRFDCGDFIDRIDKFNQSTTADKNELASGLFKDNDIENTALKLAENLYNFIQEYQPTSIHFHNSFFISPYALYFLKQTYKLRFTPKYYFWCHSPTRNLIIPNGEKSKLYSALVSFQNLFSGVWAVSKIVHQQLLNVGIKNKVKYLGVDIKFFEKRENITLDIRKNFDLTEGSFLLTYTGRFLKEKGLDLLPVIYKKLVDRDKKHLSINVLLVGEGIYKEKFEKIIKKENLDHRFHFTKAENDNELVDIYSQSNCFILPTRREALGLSLMEAMSCSLPCIATDLEGTRELITHTKSGILISDEKIDEYVRWISSIFESKNLSDSLSKTARNVIEENFSFNTHLNYFTRRLLV